jgi:hypothetical protein
MMLGRFIIGTLGTSTRGPMARLLHFLRERLLGFRATREAPDLRPRRPAPVQAVAVRPKRLPVGALCLQLENLTLLNHRVLLDRRSDRGTTTATVSARPPLATRGGHS